MHTYEALFEPLFVPDVKSGWAAPLGTISPTTEVLRAAIPLGCGEGAKAMVTRVKLTHPALKHGGYSSLAVLPGEDRAEFEKKHRQLIAEYSPSGPLEDHLILVLARLMWREENLSTFAVAKTAREPFMWAARSEVTYIRAPGDEEFEAAQCAAAVKAEEEGARKQLGELYPLVAIGEVATIPHLTRELHLRERLNEMIAKCIKQLILAKGLKSISPIRSLSAPSKAA